jgi:hypothetical protein
MQQENREKDSDQAYRRSRRQLHVVWIDHAESRCNVQDNQQHRPGPETQAKPSPDGSQPSSCSGWRKKQWRQVCERQRQQVECGSANKERCSRDSARRGKTKREQQFIRQVAELPEKRRQTKQSALHDPASFLTSGLLPLPADQDCL